MSSCGVEHISGKCSFLASHVYSYHKESVEFYGVLCFVPRGCKGLLSWQLTRNKNDKMKMTFKNASVKKSVYFYLYVNYDQL